MYEARVEGLALARLENGADINGPLSAELPEGGYEAAAEYLSGLPFVERTELLESGESVFYCNSGDNAPSGLALSYYEAMGSASSWYPDLGEWGDYAVTLRADGSLEFAPYEGSRAPEPTQEPSPEPTEPEPTPTAQTGDAMLEGIESDGEYLLTLYPRRAGARRGRLLCPRRAHRLRAVQRRRGRGAARGIRRRVQL